MINIRQVVDNSLMKINKSIDIHHNILIIGAGETNHNLNQIAYFSHKDSVEDLYGVSELSEAYSLAKKVGCNHIFLANIKTKFDYIALLDTIKFHDFAYIIPLGFKLSDSFFNPKINREQTYVELYLDTLRDLTNSTLVVTDNHANLYEDIDSFINDMEIKIMDFKTQAEGKLYYGNNLIFIANNLEDYKKASLILGCVLCNTKIGQYPIYDYGKAIFDIDASDIWQNEFAYFKNNNVSLTSVENLNNFRDKLDADKVVTIDTVIKFIQRELDFSEFKGRLFSEYIRMQMFKLITDFFELHKDKVRNHKVNSINFVTTEPGSGVIIIKLTICPINSIEFYDISVEV